MREISSLHGCELRWQGWLAREKGEAAKFDTHEWACEAKMTYATMT